MSVVRESWNGRLTAFPDDLKRSSNSADTLKYLKSTITSSYSSTSCLVANLWKSGGGKVQRIVASLRKPKTHLKTAGT